MPELNSPETPSNNELLKGVLFDKNIFRIQEDLQNFRDKLANISRTPENFKKIEKLSNQISGLERDVAEEQAKRNAKIQKKIISEKSSFSELQALSKALDVLIAEIPQNIAKIDKELPQLERNVEIHEKEKAKEKAKSALKWSIIPGIKIIKDQKVTEIQSLDDINHIKDPKKREQALQMRAKLVAERDQELEKQRVLQEEQMFQMLESQFDDEPIFKRPKDVLAEKRQEKQDQQNLLDNALDLKKNLAKLMYPKKSEILHKLAVDALQGDKEAYGKWVKIHNTLDPQQTKQALNELDTVLADKSNPNRANACYMKALIYYNYHPSLSSKEALKDINNLLAEAAMLGHGAAALDLAKRYDTGFRANKDPEKSLYFYRLAVKADIKYIDEDFEAKLALQEKKSAIADETLKSLSKFYETVTSTSEYESSPTVKAEIDDFYDKAQHSCHEYINDPDVSVEAYKSKVGDKILDWGNQCFTEQTKTEKFKDLLKKMVLVPLSLISKDKADQLANTKLFSDTKNRYQKILEEYIPPAKLEENKKHDLEEPPPSIEGPAA